MGREPEASHSKEAGDTAEACATEKTVPNKATRTIDRVKAGSPLGLQDEALAVLATEVEGFLQTLRIRVVELRDFDLFGGPNVRAARDPGNLVLPIAASKENQDLVVLVVTLLSGADLSGAGLIGANLSWAHLPGADLSGADLSGADLIGANLSGANLRATALDAAKFKNALLANADLRDGEVSVTSIDDASPGESGAPGKDPKGRDRLRGLVLGSQSNPASEPAPTWVSAVAGSRRAPQTERAVGFVFVIAVYLPCISAYRPLPAL